MDVYEEEERREKQRQSLPSLLVPTVLPSSNGDAFQGGGRHSEDKPFTSSGVS